MPLVQHVGTIIQCDLFYSGSSAKPLTENPFKMSTVRINLSFRQKNNLVFVTETLDQAMSFSNYTLNH